MGGMQILLDIGLGALLILTLFHAMRLERALGVLKRDRASLQELVSGFNGATRQAELGVVRLREAADGAGRHVANQIEAGAALKEDLVFLVERAEKLADRLELQLRHARSLEMPKLPAPPDFAALPEVETPRVRSEAERELLKALRMAR